MIKKIIAAILAAIMAAIPAMADFTDITDPTEAEAARTLATLGVLDGLGDGSFRPDDYVTREQFAKIAVRILGQEEKASASLSATAFTDVSPDSWALGYISYVAETGIIAGFPDGSFGGKNVLTFAQAVTVLMRCMDYTDSDIGFHWPSDFVSKARALGLDKGVSLNANDYVTRGDMAVIVNNALDADLNGQEDVTLASKAGITVYDDALLYGLNKSDSSIIETSEGGFKAADGAIGADSFGKTGTLYVSRDKEILMFKSDGGDGQEIVVASCLSNADRRTVDISWTGGAVSLPYSGTVFADGEKTTAEAVAADITTGSRIKLFYDETGAFKSAVVDIYTMEGPKTVTTGGQQIYDLFAIASAPSVIRRGVRASIDDIAIYDVVYYDANTNTVYAYDAKVSGTYEKAEPYKSSVTQVTVGGKSYKIGAAEAMNKLNESAGAFAIGDFVTLLLDRNGDIADVVDSTASIGRSLAVVLDSYRKTDEHGNQGYAVKLFLPDGSEMEYKSNIDYSDKKGRLMELSFADGAALLRAITYSRKDGKLDKELMTFDGSWISSDCSVLVLAANPDDGPAVVRKIRLSDIDGSSLSRDQVIHAELSGPMKDVTLLYLQNVTKADYEYGVITATDTVVERDEEGNIVRKYTSGSYAVLLHGEETSVNAGRRVFATPVIGINTLTGGFTDAVLMDSGKKITAVSGDRVKVDNTVYRAAAGFEIYRRENGEYSLISAEEAMRLGSAEVEIYGDESVRNGGRVRIIIIR